MPLSSSKQHRTPFAMVLCIAMLFAGLGSANGTDKTRPSPRQSSSLPSIKSFNASTIFNTKTTALLSISTLREDAVITTAPAKEPQRRGPVPSPMEETTPTTATNTVSYSMHEANFFIPSFEIKTQEVKLIQVPVLNPVIAAATSKLKHRHELVPSPTEETRSKKSSKTASDLMHEDTTNSSKSSSEANESVTLAAQSPGLNPFLGKKDAAKTVQHSFLAPLESTRSKRTSAKAMDSKCGPDLEPSLELGSSTTTTNISVAESIMDVVVHVEDTAAEIRESDVLTIMVGIFCGLSFYFLSFTSLSADFCPFV
jgi:hypothetical protein